MSAIATGASQRQCVHWSIICAPVISDHKAVSPERPSPQQIPPSRLPGQGVGEHWCRPLELLSLQVQLLVILADLPGGGRQVLAETNLSPGKQI